LTEAQAGPVEQAPADQPEPAAQAADDPVEPAPTAAAPADEPAAAEEAVPTGEPVTVDASPPTRPERISYVPPSYPRTAAMRGTEGWVDVEFSLTAAGEPRNIEVTDASPADTFDEAAIDAVGQWRYQPPAESGWPEDERIRIRINFGLDR
jgi:protein TonB